MKRIHVYITDDQLGRLQAIKSKNHLNISHMMRAALDDYIDSQERYLKFIEHASKHKWDIGAKIEE